MWLMQFNLVNNKEMLIFLWLWVHDGVVFLAVSGLSHTCTGSCRSYIWPQCNYLEPRWKERCAALFFCFPTTTTPFFFFFPLSTVITVWWVPQCPCIGVHGWVVWITSHGSVLLSRGWLIAVEAPGHPGQPPSTQLNAVVNYNKLLLPVFLSMSYD